jgi:hypothetical protein
VAGLTSTLTLPGKMLHYYDVCIPPVAPVSVARCSSCGAVIGKSKRFVVVVQDDDIIVGVSGIYAVYYKPSNQPQLILRRRSETDDNELLAQAWQAANDKARELGWIV